MSDYTPAIVAKMEAIGAFNYESAVAFAEANGLKPRSVIAKVKSLGLEYTPKPTKVTKKGEPSIGKDEIAASISEALKVSLPSLVKMTKADLAILAKALV